MLFSASQRLPLTWSSALLAFLKMLSYHWDRWGTSWAEGHPDVSPLASGMWQGHSPVQKAYNHICKITVGLQWMLLMAWMPDPSPLASSLIWGPVVWTKQPLSNCPKYLQFWGGYMNLWSCSHSISQINAKLKLTTLLKHQYNWVCPRAVRWLYSTYF